jgi:hypothetical protein
MTTHGYMSLGDALALTPGQKVRVLVDCIGDDDDNQQATVPAGSIVTVHSVTTLGDPQGFAVTVYAANGVSNVFDEGDYDGLYPFSPDLRDDQ